MTQTVRGADEMLRVIYVMGAGRSGSTILDMILGQHPDVLSAGELTNLSRIYAADEEFCSCGDLVKHCEFWRRVIDEWVQSTGAELSYLLERQNRVERQRRALTGLFTSQEGVIADDYGRLCYALFQSIAAVSSKRIIVDSSKNPLRALALSRIPGIDLRIVHLVRDPRGVANSLKKALAKDPQVGVQRDLKAKPLARTAAFWNIVNWESDYVARRMARGSVIRLRYEDLVFDVAAALEEISRLASIDLTSVAESIRSGEAATPGHMVAGNRLRMSGQVRLEPDLSWVRQLTKNEQRLVAWLTGLLRSRYGYPLSQRSRSD